MDKHDFVTTVPSDEKGAQLGESSYGLQSIIEAETLISQIIDTFGEPPGESMISMASHDHEFGTYRSVYIIYDDSNEEEVDYFQQLEYEFPANWSDASIEKLKKRGYEHI